MSKLLLVKLCTFVLLSTLCRGDENTGVLKDKYYVTVKKNKQLAEDSKIAIQENIELKNYIESLNSPSKIIFRKYDELQKKYQKMAEVSDNTIKENLELKNEITGLKLAAKIVQERFDELRKKHKKMLDQSKVSNQKNIELKSEITKLKTSTKKIQDNDEEFVKKHEQLINKHKLLENEHKKSVKEDEEVVLERSRVIKSYITYLVATTEMNDTLELFSKSVSVFVKSDKKTKLANYESLKNLFKIGNEKILNAQIALIRQNSIFLKIAHKHKKDTDFFKILESTKSKGLTLSGVQGEHQALWDVVTEAYIQAGGKFKKENEVAVTENELAAAEIELSAAENLIGKANPGTGSGIGINHRNEVVVYKADEFRKIALQKGFTRQVVDDGQTIARAMKGVIGMATTKEELVVALTNLISHMKVTARSNADDLEIALIVDYSLNMSINIETILLQLNELINSFQSVLDSGRLVRLAIVTFGRKGAERIDLDLTTDFTQVHEKLSALLAKFNEDNHGMVPGESSFYGLRKSSELKWKSKNRHVVIITNEESYSLQRGHVKFVNSVMQEMSDIKVYPLIIKN